MTVTVARREKLQEMKNRVCSLLLHLRDEYSYCYHCSLQCSSAADLLQLCQEVTESDHDNDEAPLEEEEGLEELR